MRGMRARVLPCIFPPLVSKNKEEIIPDENIRLEIAIAISRSANVFAEKKY